MGVEEESHLIVSNCFGINAAAGICTVIGGFVIFSNKLLQLANPQAMAVLLSISGGITLFQCYVILWTNSVKEFTDALGSDLPEDDDEAIDWRAWLCATGCLGAGILFGYLVDYIVHKLTPGQNPNGMTRMEQATERDSFDPLTDPFESKPPVEFIREQGGMDVFIKMDETAKEKLQAMGVLSALAVGIHNIPEGMATFVASSEHPYVGFSLAIGVGLHNIAEGIAVAAPIYFATGSHFRALMWCFLATIAQHVGGLIALISLGMDSDNLSQGVLYGLVMGMLIGIVMKEIIPTAYMYANGRMQVVSAGFLLGTFLMTAGYIFFKYIGV